MLKGGLAVGDKSFAGANAQKEGLVAIKLKPLLILVALCQPAFTDVDQVGLHHGVICLQVLHVRLQPADVQRSNPEVSSWGSPGIWIVVDRPCIHPFTFSLGRPGGVYLG